jgi:hypothetical protein
LLLTEGPGSRLLNEVQKAKLAGARAYRRLLHPGEENIIEES